MAICLEKTVGLQLRSAAENFSERVAYSFPEENVEYTFQCLEAEVDAVAKALIASGMKKADHIAIWSTNCSKWILLLLGAAKLGVTIAPINTNYKRKELEYIAAKSDAKMLFYMPVYRGQKAVDALGGMPELPGVWNVCMGEDVPRTGCLGWDAFLARGAEVTAEVLAQAAAQVAGEDFYSIQFTSGTTAMPKGALLQHASVLRTAQTYANCLHLDETDITAIPLPLFHVFGNVLTALSPLITGSCALYQAAFSANSLIELLENKRCTTLAGVPTMYLALIGHPTFQDRDLSALKKGAMGGAYCPPAVAEKIDRTLDIKLSIGFGMSECASLCTFSDIDAPMEQRLHSVGSPIEDVEVKVLDKETGELLSVGGPGEMLVRGYCVMSGYYNSPEETQEALDSEGWLHTGDVCFIDESGAVHVTGRLKDIIIRGGENISPSEIEEVLLSMDNVKDVRCVGVSDKVYGEEIAAFLITKDGGEIDPDAVRQYAKERLAFFKIPRYVFTIKEFPINGAGKVLTRELREIAKKLVSDNH